jgi:hypothetical protein
MTELFQMAFKKASALPVHLQDMLAKELLQEMEWEEKWDNTLANSQSALDELAIIAMQKYKTGQTIEKGFDEL